MKHLILIGAGLVLSGACASAQETNTASPPAASTQFQLAPDEQKALNDAIGLLNAASLWNKALDWDEHGATISEVTAHIHQGLGKDAPSIEVRGQDNTLTTFTLPHAPFGPTLTSLAALGNYQVWVFPGRLLLAPETALTTTEKEAVKERTCGEWKRSEQTGVGYWDASKQISTVAVPLIGADIKAHLEAKGQKPDPDAKEPKTSNDHLPYEIPLRELSPTSQVALQKMSDAKNIRYDSSRQPHPLDPSLTVCYDETNGSQRLELRTYDPEKPDNVLHRGQWYSSR